MENAIVFDNKPELKDPVFIEGLPGVGNVGKIAADYMKEKLNATKFANIYSKHLPPQVNLDENCIASLVSNELWYAKDVNGRDLIFLLGDYQGVTPEGQFVLAEEIMTVLIEMNVSRIFTLGGYGTGLMVEEPRILGAVTSMDVRNELEKHGVIFSQGEPGAGIVGASGLLLGLAKIKGIDAACLMGETSGYFLDHKSASSLLSVLKNILGFEIDMEDLNEKSKQLAALTEKVKEYEVSQDKESLGYIG
jgi:TIGR00162 family protein